MLDCEDLRIRPRNKYNMGDDNKERQMTRVAVVRVVNFMI